jgi:hypothetical protein
VYLPDHGVNSCEGKEELLVASRTWQPKPQVDQVADGRV